MVSATGPGGMGDKGANAQGQDLKEPSGAPLTWATERKSSNSQAGTMVRTGLRDVAVRIQPDQWARIPSHYFLPSSPLSPSHGFPRPHRVQLSLHQLDLCYLSLWERQPGLLLSPVLLYCQSCPSPAHPLGHCPPRSSILVLCLGPFHTNSPRDLKTDWPPLPLRGACGSPPPARLKGIQLLNQAHPGPQAQPSCLLVLAPTRVSMGVSPPYLRVLPDIASPACTEILKC